MAIESPIGEADNWFTGEDKLLVFTVYQQDNKTVQNVTGWSFEWKLYRRRDSATPLVAKASGSGVTILDAVAGKVSVRIDAEDTDDFDATASYNYVLRRSDPGNKNVLAYGGAIMRSAVNA